MARGVFSLVTFMCGLRGVTLRPLPLGIGLSSTSLLLKDMNLALFICVPLPHACVYIGWDLWFPAPNSGLNVIVMMGTVSEVYIVATQAVTTSILRWFGSRLYPC